MSDCNACPSKDGCEKDKEQCMIENNPMSNVKNIIGVMSGKGQLWDMFNPTVMNILKRLEELK